MTQKRPGRGREALPGGLLRPWVAWAARPRTIEVLQAGLEAASVELIAENGGGAGVPIKKDKVS